MLEILWQDDDILAVNKPAGLATVPGRSEPDSVLDQFPGTRIVHRIDKFTSGVLLLARSRDAQRELTRQFMNREVKKEYLALVAGEPAEDSGVIDQPLARHPKAEQICVLSKHAQPAVTEWEVVKRFRGLTLLKCRPQTGRMHQVRVHLKSIGLPLAVDPVYSASHKTIAPGVFLSHYKANYHPNRGQIERPLIGRLTLHAERIEFTNLKGRRISVSCPPARDLSATINQLTKHACRGGPSGSSRQ
jgi:23S rRNA pseudouridine1911/1915/1917 synthase